MPALPLFFDRDGKPMQLFEWSEKFEDMEYRRVAFDELTQVIIISTIWMGVSPIPDHDRLIFVTKVFGTQFDGQEERYATEAEARTGHERWVKKVTATIN